MAYSNFSTCFERFKRSFLDQKGFGYVELTSELSLDSLLDHNCLFKSIIKEIEEEYHFSPLKFGEKSGKSPFLGTYQGVIFRGPGTA